MEVTFSSTTGKIPSLPITKSITGGRNSCSISIARCNKFVQLSFSSTRDRTNKSNLFKVLSTEKDHVQVVEGSGVDEIYDTLVKRILPPASMSLNPNYKVFVGLAGPPGAGKSTIAHEVAKRINKLWPEKTSSFDSQVQPPDVAIVIRMDGFHLYRSELDAMKNPEEAHARRGAPWTFNPTRLLTCLKNVRVHGSVYAPSFDHGVGDPVQDAIFVNLEHKIIIVEGNFCSWKMGHISTGKPPDIAKQRIENNDRLNAELIMKSKEKC
ncbi:phosphoribulokinase/uridine kinase family protein [Medicago truncatula]|uniref:Phosphoribulokinase/uridine kinase family protein n=1 Tax=Medicago truncatula TaxID=3880 RepID=G7JPM6_MEDTR|nr:phosphoribulokinase/uridine kinase family protein [Medicago truncatula]